MTAIETAGSPASDSFRASPAGHGPWLWNNGAERLGRNPLT